MSAQVTFNRPPRAARGPAALTLVKGASISPIAEEVRRGLGATPKTLSPHLFYDERGSQLFEAITQAPEYYLTRAEREIFETHADEIIAAASNGELLSVVELGAGTAEKTGVLLAAVLRQQPQVIYQPVDVSSTALDAAVHSLSEKLPGARVQPLVADYTEGYANLPRPAGRRLALYIGSSIGNFSPELALSVLQQLRGEMQANDSLLLGTDLRKDEATLLAAYNDLAGITAAFNKNVLARINRELDADFELETFRHEARWNTSASRIEMHLVSDAAQQVEIAALGLRIAFAAGESIHTENSYKFTPTSVAKLLARAGFSTARQWSDSGGRFLETLASAR